MTSEGGLSGQRFVGWISIASFALCLIAIYAILAAVEFEASLGYLPVEAIPVANPQLVFLWGVTDFLGYYMLRAPLVLLLWRAYRGASQAWADSVMFCGLLFIVLSVTATSVMTGATMGILEIYADSSAATQTGLEGGWEASLAAVRKGLWQFSMLPWTVWTLAMGAQLAKDEPLLGRALQTIGIAAAISALDPLFGPRVEASLGPVHDYQVHFSSIWMLWAGIVLVRRDRVLGTS